MANARIVVVDDDQDIRDSVQAILEAQQYTVVTAADKAEGMEKIHRGYGRGQSRRDGENQN
jgi:DNA-binding NtrC family response regulator